MTAPGSGDRVSRPLCYRAARMQTSLARRQRHRRLGDKRRPRGSGAARAAAVALPRHPVRDPPDAGRRRAARRPWPRTRTTPRASRIRSRPSTTSSSTSRRSSTTGPARSSSPGSATIGARSSPSTRSRPRSSTRRPRSRTRTSGRTPASTRSGFVSAGLDTLNGRPRRLDDHPAARPRPAPPGERLRGLGLRAQDPEIIQSIRLTQAYPGEEGKQTIIDGYLNQNFYGNQSYGVKAAAESYFGKELTELTLAQTAILAGDPAVADQVRPRQERRRGDVRGRGGRGAGRGSSSRPTPRSSRGATTSST